MPADHAKSRVELFEVLLRQALEPSARVLGASRRHVHVRVRRVPPRGLGELLGERGDEWAQLGEAVLLHPHETDLRGVDVERVGILRPLTERQPLVGELLRLREAAAEQCAEGAQHRRTPGEQRMAEQGRALRGTP